MENTNKKRYWLKWGVSFLIIYIIIGGISYYLFLNCENGIISPGLLDFHCLYYTIPAFIASAPFFEIVNDYLPNGVILLINALIWFLAGSIFGWLYGKIKNRKSSVSSSNV